MSFPQMSAFGFSGTDWPATLIDRNWQQDDFQNVREDNWRAQERGFEFNSAEAAKARDFSERMSNTSWQRGVSDMRAAGINPMLAAAHGSGASSPVGSPAHGSGIGGSAPRGVHFGNVGGSSSFVTSAQVANIEAQTAKTRAEEKEVVARTDTYPVSIDKMRQEISESHERINKIIAETNFTSQEERTSAARQFNLQQHTQNMREEVPKIRAAIELLHSQVKQSGAITGLTVAQSDEVRQRIKSNLPQIDRALKEVEEKLKALEVPRAGMEAAAHDSFAGAVRALGRILPGAGWLFPK